MKLQLSRLTIILLTAVVLLSSSPLTYGDSRKPAPGGEPDTLRSSPVSLMAGGIRSIPSGDFHTGFVSHFGFVGGLRVAVGRAGYLKIGYRRDGLKLEPTDLSINRISVGIESRSKGKSIGSTIETPYLYLGIGRISYNVSFPVLIEDEFLGRNTLTNAEFTVTKIFLELGGGWIVKLSPGVGLDAGWATSFVFVGEDEVAQEKELFGFLRRAVVFDLHVGFVLEL